MPLSKRNKMMLGFSFLFLLIYLLSIVLRDFTENNLIFNGLIIFVLLSSMFYWLIKKNLFGLNNVDRCILFISIISFAVRLIYILNTGWNIRQHDIGSIEKMNGHSGYIYYIYKNIKLPDFDPTLVWQFYHPPFHHILAAMWMHMHDFLNYDIYKLLESVQFLTLYYSLIGNYLVYTVLKLMQINGRKLIASYSLIIFTPIFVVLSSLLNNDQLSFLFILIIIIFTIKWIEEKSLKNIVPISLSFAFGMLTKLSVATMAFPVGIVFIYSFIKAFLSDGNEFKGLFIQYIVFLCICAPIGMSWALRCYIKFGMPFNYVPSLGNDSWQYITGRSVLSRIAKINIMNIYLHSDSFIEYNVFGGLLKTWLFDEMNLLSLKVHYIAAFLFYLNFSIVIISVINGVIKVLKKELTKAEKFIFLSLVIMLISYIAFCFEYPFMCTMNIRYIMLLPIAVYANFIKDDCEEKIYEVKNCAVLLYDVFSIVLVLMVTVV